MTPGNADRLILAIHSKGRLESQTRDFLATSGIAVTGGTAREYVGRLEGVPDVELAFLQSGEIVAALERGSVHVGITGEDMLRESSADMAATISLIRPLGFGRADLVVAAPRAWIDVRNMSDLDEVAVDFHNRHGRRLRVATKYLNLARDFFASHGIADYRIVESLGATEGAPNAGAAELIVDITSTGTTLAANDLKVLDDGIILRSEAQLAGSLAAPWSPAARDSLRHILDMIEARARARTMLIVRARANPNEWPTLEEKLVRDFGCAAKAGGAGDAHEVYCARDRLYAAVAALRHAGCGDVVVEEADYLFEPENALYDAFIARLNAPAA